MSETSQLQDALTIVVYAAAKNHDQDCFPVEYGEDGVHMLPIVERAFHQIGFDTELSQKRGEIIAIRRPIVQLV